MTKLLKLKYIALKSTMSSEVLIHLVPAAQGFNQSFFTPPLFGATQRYDWRPPIITVGKL